MALSLKILLVEDEPGLRMTVFDRLVSEGYAVEGCEDGETALEKIAEGLAGDRRATSRHHAGKAPAGARPRPHRRDGRGRPRRNRRRVSKQGSRPLTRCAPPGERWRLFRRLAAEEAELKRFLYDRLYDSPSSRRSARRRADRRQPRRGLSRRPALLPPAWQRGRADRALRTIGDFIAGMTDRFAIARHEELVGPVELPDRPLLNCGPTRR